MGVRVEVISFRGNTSSDLIDVADTFTDITQMKMAEEKLVVSKQGLLDILESISDGFFTVDRGWKVIFANQEAEKFWKKSRGGMIGRSLWEIAPRVDDTPFSKHLRKAMEEKVTVAFEDHPFPGNIPMEIRAYPLKNGLSVYFHEIKRLTAENAG